MMDVIVDTFLDVVKLLPFLLITFIVIEIIEHKLNNKKIISKAGSFGPIVGGLLGAFPQCGFSVSATNLYATRIITMGTLVAIFLSTSDEMLPIMLSEKVDIRTILQIIGLKVFIGIISGLIVDFIFRKKYDNMNVKICEDEHCHCEKGIFISALKHTLNVTLFITIITFVLNITFYFVGEESIKNMFIGSKILAPFICSLFGLIPNCAASVILTELYINGTLSLGSSIAGLLTGSGIAILVLLKTNKNIKENIKIISIIYFVGVLSGIILNLIGV